MWRQEGGQEAMMKREHVDLAVAWRNGARKRQKEWTWSWIDTFICQPTDVRSIHPRRRESKLLSTATGSIQDQRHQH
jgi:hypothetical protein